MIYIDRHRVDELGNTIEPPAHWFQRAKATTQRAIAEGPDHQPSREIYAHDDVHAALEKLFHSKCAYCESSIAAATWDVEHFRPKGRVAENRTHSGYYWLTYTWENLYPACEFCNQRRRDRPTWEDRQYGITGGKADQFPLEDENTRAMTRDGNIDAEKRLLIDPCSDEPSEYITYNPKGHAVALDNNPCGKATIAVCNLQRRRLNKPRSEVIDHAIQFLRLIKRYEDEGNNEMVNELRGRMKDFLLADRCYYAGAARAVVSDPDAFGV